MAVLTQAGPDWLHSAAFTERHSSKHPKGLMEQQGQRPALTSIKNKQKINNVVKK